jgi:transcriptional/translational regulatory protein YebC/TACO1
VLTVESGGSDAEEIALQAIDAGAEDVRTEKDYIEIYTPPQELENIRKAIEGERHVISAELSLIPKTTMLLGEKEAAQALALLDHLDELDDVQHVFSNVDFSDATLEKLRGQV